MGPGGPGGEPMWPVPGPYMQQTWQRPPAQGGLFGSLGGSPTNAPTLWFDGQYLLMFPKSMPLGFPLVTTGAPAGLGVLGQANTVPLHGAGDLSLGAASGFRLTGGFFRPSDRRIGLEVSGLYVAPTSNDFFGRSAANGVPVIGRPYFNTATGANAALLVAFPNFVSGSVLSRATSEFWGIDASGLWAVYRSAPDGMLPMAFNLLGGFRFASLDESLHVSQQSTLLGNNTAPYAGITVGAPTSIEVHDRFTTSNRFYGGQLGFQWQVTAGRWFGGVSAKVGLGMIHQEVRIDGASGAANPATQNPNTLASVAVGGLFANASNIGVYRDDRFGILTDVNGTLGYNVTKFLTLTAGYNFIHMNSVARPTNQFNGRVDPALVPTSASFGGRTVAPNTPFQIQRTDYWLHGLNFGFIARY
jgi:hypothetical protein